ncbi:MAG: methyltransferase [Candidatus Aminicenantes bacterium]|nr:methyltransferase [Candidatus Aminicenantes bacterium]
MSSPKIRKSGPHTVCGLPPIRIREDETLDAFYRGRVLVLQRKRGYRFALDAPLLADFIRTRRTDELLELGTGSGIISLLVGLRPTGPITAIEIQPALADIARRNVAINRMNGRITVVRRDFRTYRRRKKFDIVFANPPYIRKRTGFLSATAEKSVAKHELKCDIVEVMQAAARLLKDDGRAYFVFPPRRRDDLETAARASGLHLHAVRDVHPRPGAEANLFLAECGFAAKAERVLPPLVLYDDRGGMTAETRRIFEGRNRGPAH